MSSAIAVGAAPTSTSSTGIRLDTPSATAVAISLVFPYIDS